MLGKLLDRTECQLLLDTGASKSFMSKSLVFHTKTLCEAKTPNPKYVQISDVLLHLSQMDPPIEASQFSLTFSQPLGQADLQSDVPPWYRHLSSA